MRLTFNFPFKSRACLNFYTSLEIAYKMSLDSVLCQIFVHFLLRPLKIYSFITLQAPEAVRLLCHALDHESVSILHPGSPIPFTRIPPQAPASSSLLFVPMTLPSLVSPCEEVEVQVSICGCLTPLSIMPSRMERLPSL